MTGEEIKERLSRMLEVNDFQDCYQEVLEEAIKLVDRSIPKKLESEMIFICPSCGMEAESKTMAFCQNCGQRFMREEEE